MDCLKNGLREEWTASPNQASTFICHCYYICQPNGQADCIHARIGVNSFFVIAHSRRVGVSSAYASVSAAFAKESRHFIIP